MSEREFCLLYDPWILVMRHDGITEELSIIETLSRAHELKDLSGEVPAQDIALLRFLLAILHAVFARYSPDGRFDDIKSPETALKRWSELFERGSLPMGIITRYLNHYKDRFYLYPPEKSFFQVPSLGKATYYTAAKLNGEISESGNKIRLFPQRTGQNKQQLSYAEAARWVFFINAFDDTAAKPSEKGLPSPGAGWLGKIGLVMAAGESLFETLMLNLILLPDGENSLWDKEQPSWELELRSEERTAIPLPRNLSSLYTIQSRRIALQFENDKVSGYYLLGGDFFSSENAFSEQMTIWKLNKTASNVPIYTPKRHDPSRQLWRDFASLLVQSENNERRPGIINWLSRLKYEKLISKSHFSIKTAGVKYGDKDFFINDLFSDTLTFNSNLTKKSNEHWIWRIIEEINTSEKLVRQTAILGRDIARAAGDDSGETAMNMTKEQCYYQLDLPFRAWLESIDPDHDDIDSTCDEWFGTAQRIVRKIGAELVEKAGIKAFVGREIEDDKTQKRIRYTASEAYNRFLYYTSTRKALHGGK